LKGEIIVERTRRSTGSIRFGSDPVEDKEPLPRQTTQKRKKERKKERKKNNPKKKERKKKSKPNVPRTPAKQRRKSSKVRKEKGELHLLHPFVHSFIVSFFFSLSTTRQSGSTAKIFVFK